MRLLAGIFLMILMLGCVEPQLVSKDLDRVDSLVDEYPDSAWMVLHNVGPDGIVSRSDMAHYSRLYVQVCDKNFIDITDDSLIKVAYTYYCDDDNGTDRDRMLAAYYYAVVLRNRGEYTGSIIHAMTAVKYAESIDDNFYLGLIYRLICNNNMAIYNNSQALVYIEKAISAFSRAGALRYKYFAQLSKAIVLSNTRQYLRSVTVIDSLLRNISVEDSAFVISCKYSLICPFMGLRLYNQAKSLLLYLDRSEMIDLSPSEYAYLAQTYFSENKLDSGMVFLRTAMSNQVTIDDEIACQDALSDYYKLRGMGDSLKLAIDRFCFLKDSLVAMGLAGSWSSAREQMLEKEVLQKESEIEREQNITGIIVIFIVCALLIVMAYVRHMNVVHGRELQNQVEAGKRLVSETRSEYERMVNGLERQLSDEFDVKVVEVNQLLNDVYKAALKSNAHAVLYNKVLERVEWYKSDEWLCRLENAVDLNHNNVMHRLREQLPALRKQDYAMLVYLISGLDSVAISMVMDIEPTAYPHRKSRLKKKITESGASDKSEFLSWF